MLDHLLPSQSKNSKEILRKSTFQKKLVLAIRRLAHVGRTCGITSAGGLARLIEIHVYPRGRRASAGLA